MSGKNTSPGTASRVAAVSEGRLDSPASLPESDTSSNGALQIRALNPDDDAEARSLAALYEEGYGEDHPLSDLRSAAFWKTHAGQRFISLTVRSGRQVIAHVGLRTDQSCPAVVELLFPMVSAPNAEAREAANSIWGFIEHLAPRKGWRAATTYIPVVPTAQGICALSSASDLLGMNETAIVPIHRVEPVNGPADEFGGDIVALYRIIAEPAAQLADDSQPDAKMPAPPCCAAPRQIFVPERHRAAVRWLSSKFGVSEVNVSKATLRHTPTEGPGIYSRMSRRLSTRITVVNPELIESNREISQTLGANQERPHVVLVPCESSLAIAVGALVEELGYRFSGILPSFQGAAHSVFTLHRPADGAFILTPSLLEDSILARYLEGSRTIEEVMRDAPSKMVAGRHKHSPNASTRV